MMWPIFWPDDTQFDNPANSRHPSEDRDAGQPHRRSDRGCRGREGDLEIREGYGQTVARQLSPTSCPT